MLRTDLPSRSPPTTFHDQLASRIADCSRFPSVISVPGPDVSPLDWIAAQTDPIKLVWSQRDDQQLLAGVGEAGRVQARHGESAGSIIARCRQLLAGRTDLRLFGGLSFDGQAAWPEFGAGRFWMPRTVFRQGVMHTAVLSRDDVPRALRAARSLVVPTRPLSTALPETCHRDDAPDVEGWTQNVDEALRLVKAEVLEKLVLARQTTFHLSHQMNPIALTAKLVKATHACYHFCFQLRPNLAFLGATPERLFKREGDQLLSEAVAGTRPRGQTVGQDQRLAYDLLTSDKDQLEHDIVRKGIRQKLHHLVDSLQVDGRASVLSLARKQHLFSEVEARLKPCVSDGDLIERLHPTPAVGGHPTENALGEIARLEPFNRGWYAAPVGWVSADAAEFAVAIRSGLLRGHRLDLYSGAGIVPGSTAADEWDEIENKISDFIDIMRE